MGGKGSINVKVSVRISATFRTWLFRIGVLSLLSIVPGTMEWGGDVPVAIVAQHLGSERMLTTQIGERLDARLGIGSSLVLNTSTQVLVYESLGRYRAYVR